MSYKLTWYAVEEALHLDLHNSLSIDEMKLINRHTVDILNEFNRRLTLLIDASGLIAGYATANHLRDTQRYMDHPKLEAIVIVANNKLNRLITNLVFNIARAHVIQFDSREKAQTYMERRGFTVNPLRP